MTASMSPVIYRPSRSGPDRDRGTPRRVPIAGPEIPTAATFAEDRAPRTESSEPGSSEPAAPRRPARQRRIRRILGLQDEPTPAPEAETAQAPAGTPAETADATGSAAPGPRRRRGRGVTMSPPPVGPGEQPDDVPDSPEVDEHSERMVALGGRVRSTRLRGLRGMTISVVDETDTVVAEALTGRRGEFVIADLPAGTYRVGARDAVDDDFTEGWFGAGDAAGATVLHLDDDTSVPNIDLTLTARVGIDADFTLTDDQAVINITVIDRTTGLPAVGEVTVSTEHFRTALPLTEGCTHLTLLASSAESSEHGHTMVTRVRIQYTGAEHHAPATRTLRLR